MSLKPSASLFLSKWPPFFECLQVPVSMTREDAIWPLRNFGTWSIICQKLTRVQIEHSKNFDSSILQYTDVHATVQKILSLSSVFKLILKTIFDSVVSFPRRLRVKRAFLLFYFLECFRFCSLRLPALGRMPYRSDFFFRFRDLMFLKTYFPTY